MDINPADTAFMLVASAFVLLMTPGLAFFYGGLVGRKNVLSIMMQSMVSLGITTVLWVVVGYSLSFGSDIGGVIGNPSDFFLLNGINVGDIYNGLGIPVYLFVAYQLMFAVITPALITGAYANRMTFKAYLAFLVGWQMVIYYPFVYMVCAADGWLLMAFLISPGALSCMPLLGLARLQLYSSSANARFLNLNRCPDFQVAKKNLASLFSALACCYLSSLNFLPRKSDCLS